MEIIIGKTAGFCYGVKRAVEETKKELDKIIEEAIEQLEAWFITKKL